MPRPWNPEENYIMIEPNVKYLLSSPRAARYAPIPWYNRPPPRPAKPGPPPDKLRYVSTRRIQNAFDARTPFRQTVADDLDSLMQTFMDALLKRTRYMPCMLNHYGEHELHTLKVAREEASDHFWHVLQDQRRQKEAWERAQRAKESASECEEVDANEAEAVDAGENVEPGPEGVAAMADPLLQMMRLSTANMNSETRLASPWGGRETTEERDKRVAEHYEKLTDVMRKVGEAAEVGEKRRLMRKAAEKAEKERTKAEGQVETRKTGETSPAEAMEVEEDILDEALESGVTGAEDEKCLEAEADEAEDQVNVAPQPASPQLDGTQTPPKKRARLE
ncbi:hypothetical protein OH76DRAFT_1484434 [Lentinus brumalis]|uniref:Uncharacterized protein n=1 Tax=Lentinus brumalis TaxID=2498619 RepID=A0A371D5D1_9APHY|nr:hypothetical protein OH76DRAFT_1484434 [Polyporus brumalis]